MDKSTEIVLAWELYEQGLSKSAIARHLGRHRETIILWIAGVEQHGLKGFVDHSHKACKVPRPSRQVDALVKRHVWAIREGEEQCCGQKIAYFLEREHGIKLSVPKIYEILSQKYVLRSRKSRYQQRGPIPQAQAPRQPKPRARWCSSTRCILDGSSPSPPSTSFRARPGALWADAVAFERHL